MAADNIDEIPSNINELLKYMEEVENFKHCEDEVRAASMLETFGFSLDHVPGHLLKSKEVNANIRSLFCYAINLLEFVNYARTAKSKITKNAINFLEMS